MNEDQRYSGFLKLNRRVLGALSMSMKCKYENMGGCVAFAFGVGISCFHLPRGNERRMLDRERIEDIIAHNNTVYIKQGATWHGNN